MSDRFQTPASKRFLPPSSSTRLRSSSSLKKGSFAPPTQPTSSSPFVRTPLTNQAQHQDEIETSFEEPISENSLPSVTPPRTQGRQIPPNDSIEVDEPGDDIDGSVEQDLLPKTSTYHPSADSNKHLPPVDNHASQKVFSSPLPKRQKTSHDKHVSASVINVSSSPSLGINANFENDIGLEENQPTTPISEDNVVDDGEDVRDALATKGRFRIRPTAADAGARGDEQPVARNIFKGGSTSRSIWSETPLPIAFSPSRRKGKYEYIRGGAAETVRNWVLDVANEQVHARTGSDKTIAARTILSDPSGRFEVVVDDEAHHWLLTGQQQQRHQSKGTHGLRRDDGWRRSITIKGMGTEWELDISNTESEQELPEHLRVAVLWDSTDKV